MTHQSHPTHATHTTHAKSEAADTKAHADSATAAEQGKGPLLPTAAPALARHPTLPKDFQSQETQPQNPDPVKVEVAAVAPAPKLVPLHIAENQVDGVPASGWKICCLGDEAIIPRSAQVTNGREAWAKYCDSKQQWPSPKSATVEPLTGELTETKIKPASKKNKDED